MNWNIFGYKIVNINKINKNLEDIESNLSDVKPLLGVYARMDLSIQKAEKSINEINKLLGFNKGKIK